MTAATEMGKDYRLKFGTGNDGSTYVTLGGEKSFDWKRASNDVDTSDKEGPSGVFTPGRISFATQGTVKLPDPGLAAVFAACKTGAVIPLEVVKGAVVKYKGNVTCGNWSGTFPQDAPANYSFDMANADVPATDDLGATGA